jgi:hypothetical protein
MTATVTATILQTAAFTIIALNFIVCVLAVVHPWLMEAFRKQERQSAVILQFARPARRGGRHG